MIVVSGTASRGAELDPHVENEARALGGENLVKLVRYRAHVERGAYRETLDLCAGYVFGENLMGGHPPHFAWAKIFAHGLVQPLSILSVPGHEGLKATYNEISQTRIWQIDAWLRSVHVIYLVNAPGFKRAAAECLKTSDAGEIARFSYAITGADVLGSMVSGEILAVPISRAFGYLFGKLRPLWARFVNPKLARRGAQLAAVTLAPVAAYNLVEYFRDLRHARAAAQSILTDGLAERQRQRESARRMLMARTLTELHRALEADRVSQFETWAAAHVKAEDLKAAREDYAAMIAKPERGPDEENYRLVLKAILPVLEQLQLD